MIIEPRSGPEPRGDELIGWKPRPGNPFHGRLLRDGSGYSFWASDVGWYVIDPSGPVIRVDEASDPLAREIRLFGIPTAICSLENGDVSLHASAVEIGGEAVLFAAPGMYGKTTLAAAFTRFGHRLLAEDTAHCTLAPSPSVYPGPAVVRLRADIASQLHVPGAIGRPTAEGRVPLVFHPNLRGDGAPVPIRAIMLLRAGDGVMLRPAHSHQTARDLFALAFRLPVPTLRGPAFARIVELVAKVEVMDLVRPLTLNSLDKVVHAVEDHVARKR